MKKKILSSKKAPLKKIYFGDLGKNYYTVFFYDSEDNFINLCCSSQIGCPEKCLFCATGDSAFVRNLSSEEIREQYFSGINVMEKFIHKKNPRLLYIIMEGMGEPSYNLNNCLEGFLNSESTLRNQFDKIRYRISTNGNVNLIEPYKRFIEDYKDKINKRNFNFRFLFIVLLIKRERERDYLMPRKNRTGVEEISKKFTDFADFLQNKLKLNYLLLNYPNGLNNYSSDHVNELARVFNPQKTKIKLTKYSETGKKFSSPNQKVYGFFRESLEQRGFEVVIRELFGEDINAACGMLHYE